ncbi:MAG: hypothetical protein M3063_08705 [Actinomycetota bacterium]|nr:hypothetical protein [Actinomycetota bacterium]
MVTTIAVLTGWYVGFIIATAVVIIVVILVVVILRLARTIAIQARDVTLALDDCRANTMALWEVQQVNTGVKDINRSAASARELLETES